MPWDVTERTIKRTHVEGDFFSEAPQMRRALAERFEDSYGAGIDWKFFSVPGLYAYLSGDPRRIFENDLFGRFMARLNSWCLENLGLAPHGDPTLHLMVNGCYLGLHSDFHNGVWGYVFSLTRWENRAFSGGETLIMKDGVHSYQRHHVHGEQLYDLVPANFNQLLVFDDRIIHGTPVIQGPMDPSAARIAMVGHIRPTSPILNGCHDHQYAKRAILDVARRIRERTRSYRDVQGTMSMSVSIATGGEVDSIRVLTDHLVVPLVGHGRSESVASVRRAILELVGSLRLGAAAARSELIIPIQIPIPELSNITISLPLCNELQREGIIEGIAKAAPQWIDGNISDGIFFVSRPVEGQIRIEGAEIVAEFDPPMWVPSQRAQFEEALSNLLQKVALKTTEPGQ